MPLLTNCWESNFEANGLSAFIVGFILNINAIIAVVAVISAITVAYL